MGPRWFSIGLRNRPKLWVRKKPRVNSPLVSAAIQAYHGNATSMKATTPKANR